MVETTYHIPNAPQIALLADLHGRPYDHVIASVAAHRPELIAIAGDILYGSHPEDDVSPLTTQENVLPFLQSCAAIAPTFLSLGNHEWMLDGDDIERIRATGVVVLDNDYQTISIDGRKVVVGGLTSSYVTDYRRFLASLDDQERASTRYPKKETSEELKGLRTASERLPDTAWLEEFTADSPDAFHVVISHHPEYFPLVPDSINLVLSGHTHNGQIAYYSFRRHRWQGLWAPGQGWLPKYSKGVYEGKRLVVSAGLANTARVPRICNPTGLRRIRCGLHIFRDR